MELGLGISTYVEMCGLAPSRVLASLRYGAGGWEAATVRMLPTGTVQVVTGATPHGQGHETTWSMLVADKLGVSPDDVEVLHSDTAISPTGMDTYGSRSLAVGGTAIVLAADQVIDKARALAAHQLEVSEDDLEFADGTFRVKGSPDKEMAIQALAFAAFTAHDLPDGMEPNLNGSVTWDPPNFVFPFGSHIAVVEIDTETGKVDLVDYIAVDDCGNQVNPLIVEGQVHGGIVQGIAQALFEEAVYDDDGTLKNPTLMDYLVPTAAELPSFTLDHTTTPSPTNPMGAKGIGEAGTIASTPAVINAVVDALSPYGITDIVMPATPERVWQAIQAQQGSAGMIPAAFDYVRADSADAAIAALVEHGDEAKLLAGGHSLLPLMKLRLAAPSVLVDIGRLSDLSYVRDGGDHVAIGGLTRHRDLETSDLLAHRGAAAARTRPGRSATRRCATAAPSAARSPTATPPRTCPPCCWPCGRRSSRRAPTASAPSRSTTSSPASSRRRCRPPSCSPRSACPRPPAPAGRSRSCNRRAQDWAIVGVAAVQNGTTGHRPGEHGIGAVARRGRRSGRRRGCLRRRRGRGGRRGHRAERRPQRQRRVPSPPRAGARATSPGGVRAAGSLRPRGGPLGRRGARRSRR